MPSLHAEGGGHFVRSCLSSLRFLCAKSTFFVSNIPTQPHKKKPLGKAITKKLKYARLYKAKNLLAEKASNFLALTYLNFFANLLPKVCFLASCVY